MEKRRNERGIALVTALLLTMISLAIVMALLYIITWQTKLSAAHKRYKTAIEASHGGAEIFAKEIIPQVFKSMTTAGLSGQFLGINLVTGSSPCLNAKLNTVTAQWGSKCGSDYNLKLYDPQTHPDMTFTLQGAQTTFNVYAKIVDTIPGNSDVSGYELLDSGAGVAGISSGVAPKHLPAMYRIEVLGQRELNPLEKAQLSILYAF